MTIPDEQIHHLAQKVADCGFEKIAYYAVRTIEKDPNHGKYKALKSISDHVSCDTDLGNTLRNEAAAMLKAYDTDGDD